MASVSTHILRSMRMTGEKARGDTLSTAEQTETLAEFNTFIESCYTERLLAYALTEDTLALTTSTNSYTIGTNGAFAVARPVKIVDPCFVRDSSGYDTPLKLIEKDTYGSIVAKSSGYTIPTYLFYDPGFSATSTGTIYLYPSPSSGLTLHINSWTQFGNYSTLSQEVMLPPGYDLFVQSNFALHLAAGFVDPPAATVKLARDSKAAIKGVNLPSPVMATEAGVLGTYRPSVSILTG